MDEYIQFSAKTKNEAITKACIELGVSSDQLDIQVISEGSSGFFGFGSKPAIIKVRVLKEISEDAEIEKIVDSVKLESFKEEEKKEAPKPVPKAKQNTKTADKMLVVEMHEKSGGRHQTFTVESEDIVPDLLSVLAHS